jgi:regulator of sigma D
VWHLRKNRSRWVTTDQVITQWLKERQELLVCFYELCELQTNKNKFSNPDLLGIFFQLLIDYVSMGHFKIFEQLAEAEACSVENPELDKTLMSQILQSTLIMLDYNDKYEKNSQDGILKEDLSALGQNLAHRMDWEDQLIHHYLEITTETNSNIRPSAVSF